LFAWPSICIDPTTAAEPGSITGFNHESIVAESARYRRISGDPEQVVLANDAGLWRSTTAASPGPA
jgi:hypothetical protein